MIRTHAKCRGEQLASCRKIANQNHRKIQIERRNSSPHENKMEQTISKTRIESRMRSKRDQNLVKTIIELKSTNPELAKELAKPKRRWPAINLKDIDMVKGDVVIAGKVLSAGDLEGAKKIVAWSASVKAIEKIKEAKGTFVTIQEEMKKNPELKGLDILR